MQSVKEPFDIIVTTYEMMIVEESWFKHRYAYRYVIIDEGHKIKNEQTQLGQSVQTLSAQHRLLLTGTPLQNNLRELWSLLHWLMPDVFTVNTSDVFEEGFNITRGILDTDVLEAAKNLLERFMLRRLKSQVDLNIPPKTEMNIYLPLSPMQKWWYKRMITKLDNTTLKEIFQGAKPLTNGASSSQQDSPVVAGDDADESTVGGDNNSNAEAGVEAEAAPAEGNEELAAAFHLDEAEDLVKKTGGDRQWTKLSKCRVVSFLCLWFYKMFILIYTFSFFSCSGPAVPASQGYEPPLPHPWKRAGTVPKRRAPHLGLCEIHSFGQVASQAQEGRPPRAYLLGLHEDAGYS